MSESNIKATIFIPVYNGEKDHLKETLEAVYNQKVDFNWNLLIIDSGSRDKSLEIIKSYEQKHKNLILKQIPNTEYSHGGTRQKAAEISEGEIMVYLSQDAIPADKNWLLNMVKPFEINPKIAGVPGKQVPRNYCFPLQKRDIDAVFNAQGPADAITIYDSSSKDRNKASFYSDVCSAARRSILIEDVPYQSISYSEDQAFGKDIINKGYLKVYAGKATVVHSNDIQLSEYKGRIFDECLGLEKAGFIPY